MVLGRSTAVRQVMFALMLVPAVFSGELLATITTTGSLDPSYGSDDPWTIESELIIGDAANGTLTIGAGSDVTVNDMVFVGNPDSLAFQGTLSLTGLGSTLTIGDESEFFVGPFALGNLTVADQAILTSYDSIIGGSPLLSDLDLVTGIVEGTGYATISGGAQWNTGDGWMTVGAAGLGELAITGDNTSVTTTTSEVGLTPDAIGEVLVDQDASWTLTDDLIVGVWGDGTLTVSGGGQVQSGQGWIGGVDTREVTYEDPIFEGYGDPTGVGHVVVTGNGSLWDSGSKLVVGAWGTGDLRIEDQGEVTAEEVFIGGMSITLGEGEQFSRDLMADGTGTVTVTGGGQLNVTSPDTLYVGYSSVGTLNVEQGGDVTTGDMVIGAAPDSTGTVVVSGSGSTVTAEDIQVGGWGTGTLSISDEAEVTVDYLAIAGLDTSDVDVLPQAILDDFGEPVDSVGTVTVSDAGSTLETNTFLVGVIGTGTVEVSAGGYMSGELGVVGLGEGSSGTMTVTGTNSVLRLHAVGEEDPDYGVLGVGGWGAGLVTVSAGGLVDASRVYIGGLPTDELTSRGESTTWGEGNPSGAGTMLVTGENSRLSVTGDFPLIVGYSGTGTLTANEGGSVETNALMVGAGPNITGTMTIDNGELTVAQDAIVGGWGQGNLTVSGGGEATVGTLVIGGFDGDDAPPGLVDELGEPLGTGIVAVTGAGSVLNVEDEQTIYVGFAGDGTLEILNGGRVNSHSGVVGYEAGSVGLATIDGTGSTWSITGGETAPDLLAEGEGDMIISNGGLVEVDGADAILEVADTITVGSEGQGTLTVADGGKVFSDSVVLGGTNPEFDTLAEYFDPDADLGTGTGTATVSGAESLVQTEDLHIGFSAAGDLTIENGGQVIDADAWLGVLPDAVGTALITGTESTWSNTGNLVVGAWGQGDLTIAGGAHVTTPDAFVGGLPFELVGAEYDPDLIPDGTGTVVVTGAGSHLAVTNLSTLNVGYFGSGTMNVLEGGYVESTLAGIGVLPDSVGIVTINGGAPSEGMDIFVGGGNGTPSLWQNDGFVTVGGYGLGTLMVSGGAEAQLGGLYVGGFDPDDFPGIDVEGIGYEPDGAGTVTVTGTGSTLETSVAVVGTTGAGAMNVMAGANVNSEMGLVAFGPDSTSAVAINGEGSAWTMNNMIEGDDMSIFGVGVYGTGQVVISGEGQLTVADAVIGGFDLEDVGAEEYYETWGNPNGTGTVTVTGEGSWLDVGYDLCVGHSGIGNLLVTAGAMVTSNEAYIGDEADGVGTATVSGSGSLWIVSDNMYIGDEGTGTMTVSDEGTVTGDENAYIGIHEGSTGTVVVTGAASLWHVGGDLYVGGMEEGAGGDGSLLVNDGGEVTIWDELFIWETGLVGGDGVIRVTSPATVYNYGTIAPGNDGIGTLFIDGHVIFEEGSIFAVDINNTTSDNLLVTGGTTINGGTVQVSSEGTILGQHTYEILTAENVTGTFDVLDTALLDFSFTDANLAYEEASVLLNITAANFNDPNIARTDNQRAVGGALQGIGDEGGSDVTDAVQDLQTPDDVRGAYDQLAGQSRPPLAPMTIAGSSKFLGTVTSRVQTVQTGLVAGAFDFSPMAAAGPDQAGSPAQNAGRGQTFAVGNGSGSLADRRWGLWGRGYGLFGDRDAEGGVPGYNYDIYGGSFGVDYQFTENTLAGIVGGMSEGDVDFESSRDNTSFDATHIGLYGSFARGEWFVDSVVTYADLGYETQRFVDLLGERLLGNFDGSEFAAYVEGSRNYDLAPNLRLQPLASVQYTYLDLDSYTETGGVSALAFDGQTHESIRGSLGARLTRRLIETTGDFRADLQVRGRWVHEFGDNRSSVDSSFVTDPAVVFTVRDEEVSRDSAILGTGFSAQMSKKTRLYLDYDARLNSEETIHVLSASMQYRW